MNIKHRNIRIFLVFIVFILFVGGLFFLDSSERDFQKHEEKISVVTTLFPLYDMARAIGAARADVTFILPPGTEPHAFEPTPSMVAKIQRADIFIYTGDDMEPWAKDLIQGTERSERVIVNASDGIAFISALDTDEGNFDPHVWLDPANAKIMLDHIAHAFAKRDPEYASRYQANKEAYAKVLDEIDAAYRTQLSSCATRTIVYGGHYAFGYLSRRYDLSYVAAQGITPNAEPTANDLTRLVDQIKKNNISTIYTGKLMSPKIAQTLSDETHATIRILDPGANVSRDEFSQGITFFDIMKKNLEALRTGLGCK